MSRGRSKHKFIILLDQQNHELNFYSYCSFCSFGLPHNALIAWNCILRGGTHYTLYWDNAFPPMGIKLKLSRRHSDAVLRVTAGLVPTNRNNKQSFSLYYATRNILKTGQNMRNGSVIHVNIEFPLSICLDSSAA